MEIDLSQMFDYKIGSKGKLPLTEKIATACNKCKTVINVIQNTVHISFFTDSDGSQVVIEVSKCMHISLLDATVSVFDF